MSILPHKSLPKSGCKGRWTQADIACARNFKFKHNYNFLLEMC
ncbi:hypothetical protein NT6N_21970 [Oceaniferula spumae]|uniref:Uncharacterized protein n=1 Tax=Oceaniferula spumae TaxID=2979115 RepID=A0AAT9FML5_9BACT